MHKKYGAEGFVAISVSLDDPKDADARARVNAFLKKMEAAGMTNLIAEDNNEDAWYDKLKAGGLPLVYIFDRDNRRVKKIVDVDYKAIEAEVAKLLKK
ncbi:MAG: TlpA family protein disulfide reductase [Gemmataceae bacterium]